MEPKEPAAIEGAPRARSPERILTPRWVAWTSAVSTPRVAAFVLAASAALVPGAPFPTHVSPANSDGSDAGDVAEEISTALSNDGRLRISVHRQDGSSVEGARIRVLVTRENRTAVVREATCDGSGAAVLEALPETAVFILADGEGLARASKSIVVEKSERAIEFVLQAESVLAVDVQAEEGALPEAVDLEILGRDPLPRGARTNREGHAEIHRLSEGPYTVTARAPGYEPAIVRDVSANAKLVLKKLGTIEAHVVNTRGEPVPSARVEIVGVEVWPPRATKADARGFVRISALARGPYALRASLDASCTDVPAEIEVKKSEVTSVTLRLVPCTTLRAKVHDAERGEKIIGASVTFVEDGLSPFPIRAVTEPREGTAIALLGPSARWVGSLSVDATGFVPKLVHLNGELEADVELLRAGTLLGRVVDAQGRGVNGARLAVIGTDGAGMPIDDDPARASFRENLFASATRGSPTLIPKGELGVVPGPVPPIPRASLVTIPIRGQAERKIDPWITGESGAFSLNPVSPGTLRIVARHPEYVEGWSNTITLAPSSRENGAPEEVTITLRKGGLVEGRLEDSNARAIAGATIRIEDARSGLERSTRTADDGSFAFAAVPEAVQISATLPREFSEALRTALVVGEGKTEHVTLRLPAPRDDASIRVVDARGFPITMAQVTILSLDPSVPLRATNFSNRDGETTLAHAVGLEARLEVTAPGFSKKAVSVVVKKTDRVVLVPELVGFGEVRGRRGERIERAEVSVRQEEGSSTATTDRGGDFEISHVGTGSAHVSIFAKGYARREETILIRDTNRGRADLGRFELLEEAQVTGRVVDEQGRGVRGARVAQGHVPVLPAGREMPAWVTSSDADGSFTLRSLPEADLSLEAVFGEQVADARVRTKAGDTTRDVVLTLKNRETSERAARGSIAVTLEDQEGFVRITQLAESSTADRAGLQVGDTILAVGPKTVATAKECEGLLAGPVSTDVLVTVSRNGSESTHRVERELVRR